MDLSLTAEAGGVAALRSSDVVPQGRRERIERASATPTPAPAS